jgi:hypothetical protein
MNTRRLHTIALTVFVVVGSLSSGSGIDAIRLRRAELEPPSRTACSEPNSTRGVNGSVYLSWVETPSEDSSILRVAHLIDDTVWGEPSIVAVGTDWFVNWADFPAIAASDSGLMLASWLQSVGEGGYAYDIRLSRSVDPRNTWSAPIPVHDDTRAVARRNPGD